MHTLTQNVSHFGETVEVLDDDKISTHSAHICNTTWGDLNKFNFVPHYASAVRECAIVINPLGQWKGFHFETKRYCLEVNTVLSGTFKMRLVQIDGVKAVCITVENANINTQQKFQEIVKQIIWR